MLCTSVPVLAASFSMNASPPAYAAVEAHAMILGLMHMPLVPASASCSCTWLAT